MRRLLLSIIFFSLSNVVSGRTQFNNEVLVTSADLIDGKIEHIGEPGESYRLYAIYAGYILNHDQDHSLTEKVTIRDSQGTTFQLNEFHPEGTPSQYFLSDQRIVVGPLTVTDPTPTPPNQEPSRLPYTIYIVSTSVPAFPVVDAIETSSRLSLNSDNYNGKEVPGLTILSADQFFTLRQFNFTSDSAYIIPRGYDILSSGTKDSILDLNQKNAYSSYTTVFGPIATIVNTKSKTGRFKMTYDVATTWGSISPGSSLSLLSPNWLSLLGWYSTTWNNYGFAFDREFQYGRDTLLDFTMQASSLKIGEKVTVEIKTEKGETKEWNYGPSDKEEIRDTFYGTSLRLKATVNTPSIPLTYPRFIVKVTSDASTSAVAFSLLLLFIHLFQ